MEETMIDKTNFMETLRSVAELTRTSNEPLSREEVMSYFCDMDLTKEQQELIYQYILHPVDESEQEETIEEQEHLDEPVIEENLDSEEGVSPFFKKYEEDIKKLPVFSKEEERDLYRKLLEGEAATIKPLSDLWLPKVLAITKDYSIHQVNLEDLVQEGNIGLLGGLSRLLGNKQITQVEEYIKESIKKAMEDYIDDTMEEQDWESTVVAKATLVHEATELLTKDLERTPTNSELSEYTRLTIEEIKDIMTLSKATDKGNKLHLK